MTLNDFLKRLTDDDKDKMIVFRDGEGWSNVWFKKTENEIIIYCEDNSIFSEDKIDNKEQLKRKCRGCGRTDVSLAQDAYGEWCAKCEEDYFNMYNGYECP